MRACADGQNKREDDDYAVHGTYVDETWHTNPFKLTRKQALNEKMPGDDVKYQASSVHLFFQVNISKDA